MANISFHSEDVDYEIIQVDQIGLWLNRAIESEKTSIRSLDFILVNDSFLIEMNKKYLDHDTFTDIITFDLSDDDQKEGEIYISLERVQENARKFEVDVPKELHRVIIHGLLHLLGYNDHSVEEKKVMREKEDHYLSLLK